MADDPADYVRRYKKEDYVFRSGDQADQRFFIVLEGAVGIVHNETRLRTIGPGGFFGEMALILDSGQRSADAVAETDVVLMAVDRARFLYIISQQPAFALILMEALSRWLTGDSSATASTATEQIEKKASSKPTISVEPIAPGVLQLRSRSRSSNTYVFTGPERTILVDPGLTSQFPALCACLASAGIAPTEIDTIVLTHEHYDHIAAVPLFAHGPVVMAHPLAAHKIESRDSFALLQSAFGEPLRAFQIDRTLAEGDVVTTGRHSLQVLHTPGHTSGSVSLYVGELGLLVTGDLVMAGGPMGGIFGSGNISDTLYSLQRLERLTARTLLPGHGPTSSNAQVDIMTTIDRTSRLLKDTRMIFETLNGRDSINKLILAVRDLNR